MLYSSAFVAVAAVAPLVHAHGGVPTILGLNPKDLKARNILSNLGARIVDVHSVPVDNKKIEARQNDAQCGAGIGSCAAGVSTLR